MFAKSDGHGIIPLGLGGLTRRSARFRIKEFRTSEFYEFTVEVLIFHGFDREMFLFSVKVSPRDLLALSRGWAVS